MKRNVSILVACVMTASLMLPLHAAQNVPDRGVHNLKKMELKKLSDAKAVEAKEKLKNLPVDKSISPSFTKKEKPAQMPDRIMVKYKKDVSKAEKESFQKEKAIKPLQSNEKIGLDVFEVPTGKTAESLIQEIQKNQIIERVEKDAWVTTNEIADEQMGIELWGMENEGQPIQGVPGVANVDLDVNKAWQTTTGSGDVVVAIIDEGIDFSHPDLAGREWVNPGEVAGNGIDDDGNGYIDDINGYDFFNKDGSVYDPGDGDYHGTHVAGTIAGNLNGSGVVGVAPNVKLMSCKFLGPGGGYLSDAIFAIEYYKSFGVKISNNSWGGGGYSEELKQSILNSDSLFVCAAGNSGMDIDVSPEYPAGYDCDNILSVAAIDNTGNRAYFSNYGTKSVDVAAPGVNVLSSQPGGQFAYFNGTSMASPHVAGLAALVMSAGVQDPAAIKANIMAATVEKPLASVQGITVTGGLANALAVIPMASGDDDLPGKKFASPISNDLGAVREDGTNDIDDVFNVTLQQGELLDITMKRTSGAADNDFDLYVYGPGSSTVNLANGIVAYSENPASEDESIYYIAEKAGKYYINAHAFIGDGNYTIERRSVVIDDRNPGLIYKGTWTEVNSPVHEYGTAKTLNSAGSVVVNFTGDSIKWTGFKSSTQGYAKILVDGKDEGVVNLYSTTTLNKQVLFEKALPFAKHTMEIQWAGKWDSRAKKSATTINADTFTYNPNPPAPTIPTGLTGAAVFEQNELTWNADNSAVLAGFNVYRSDVSGSGYVKINKSLSKTPKFIDTNVEGGKTYFYVVTSQNTYDAESAKSTEVSIKANYPRPSKPTGLTASTDNVNVTLNWYANPEANIKGYNVYRSVKSGAEFYKINSELLTATSYTDLTAVPGLVAGATKVATKTTDKSNTAPSGYVAKQVEVAKPAAGNDVLLIQDVLPWGFTANNDVLTNLGLAYDVMGIDAAMATDLSIYKLVIIANDQNDYFYTQLTAMRPTLENYVQNGGNLVYGACNNGWNGGYTMPTLPGGVVAQLNMDMNNKLIDATHPIVTAELSDGVPLTEADLYGGGINHVTFDPATIVADTKTIFTTMAGQPSFIEYSLGNGTVIASGLTWEYSLGNAYPFATKAMDDMFLFAYGKTATPGTNYYYVVTAVNTYDKESVYSEQAKVRLLDETKEMYIKEDDAAVKYTGTWGVDTDKGNTDGRGVYTDTKGNALTFNFTGTGIKVLSKTSSGRGIAKITVDGVVYMSDFYSPTTILQNTPFVLEGLSNGTHIITIEATGTKNPASTSNRIQVDGFIVTIPRNQFIEESNSLISYAGSWGVDSDTKNTNSRGVYSDTKGNSATFNFTGTGIKILSKSSNSRGIAKVIIDGVEYTCDQYTPSTYYQNVPLFVSGLSSGSHTVKIEVSGTKNPKSTSSRIHFDGLVITNN
jgi:subtilisin family serine protease